MSQFQQGAGKHTPLTVLLQSLFPIYFKVCYRADIENGIYIKGQPWLIFNS